MFNKRDGLIRITVSVINESASLFLCHTWARYDIPLFF